jgi:hypothetical protein
MKETKKTIQECRNKGKNDGGTKIGINVGIEEGSKE